MKAFLMHTDRDFDLEAALPVNQEALIQDLELATLFAAMAQGDTFVLDVAKRAVFSGLMEPAAIKYRQEILRDCLDHPATVTAIYDLAVEAIQDEKKFYFGVFSDSPDTILHRATKVLEMFMDKLKRLTQISDEHAASFESDGFVELFRMLASELDDAYLETVADHLRQLQFRRGTLISAELGKGNMGTRYVLRAQRKQSWRDRLPFGDGTSYTFQIPDRDESGAKALAELRGRGINLIANALAQSTDHILSFFRMLRAELGFYVGCLNLERQLSEKGEPICFPTPVAPGEPALCCRGLYDTCLSLSVGARVVGNDVNAERKRLVIITGANQGGKSTFLRSVGLAQLMMQCGMFVTAETFRADVRDGIFTHFKREEDTGMESGKLDEELSRLSDIVDDLGSTGVLLCNESFASTNEREGSEIARQLVGALLERGIKILFVTHMYDLAHGLYSRKDDAALFLRAERQAEGQRSFRVVEGEPLPTSYGEDL